MPIHGGFHVEICDWANPLDRVALSDVRTAVFVAEQHVPVELEIDGEDPRCVHALARNAAGEPIGAGRLAPGGRIGRMAVLHDWRGQGVGSALLNALLENARAHGVTAIALHAQHDAIPFYLRHGFAAEGDEFEEAGITHVMMRRTLAAPEQRAPAPPPDEPPATFLHAGTREELIAATHTLLLGARHRLCVLVRELHPELLNDTACMVQLRRLAISGRGASIRILAQDLSRALREGSRLLELAQRLSSVIELRQPVEAADLAYPSAFMCTDTGGYLFRPVESAMGAVGSTCAPGRAVELMQLFEQVWARAEPSRELRALDI